MEIFKNLIKLETKCYYYIIIQSEAIENRLQYDLVWNI